VITARALGVYVYLKASGASISAESLSKVFAEGREAMGTALAELRKYNMVSSTKERIGNRIMTVNRLVDQDFWAPETRRLIQQTQQNSNLSLNAYSFISKKEYLGEPREGNVMDYEDTPMYLEPEERAEYLRKMRQKRDAEHRALKEQEAQRRIEEKAAKQPANWSTDDSAYHFAERMALMWHVKPWLTARTRFRAAFGQARKTHATTGDVELKMMERFFDGLEHKKHINEPDIIWKMFIRDYPSLLIAVERSTVTQEDIAEAEALSDKQWGDIF
jgi:hypothetical protein